MRVLGHAHFSLVGHDRGSYVAFRLALDNPSIVTRLALLDCIPISEHLSRVNVEFATRWWHWFFFAQPGTPERVINADPDSWYSGDPDRMGQENYDEWREATRNSDVVRAMLRDDLEELYGDPVAIWRQWADDVHGYGIDSGHHIAEDAPDVLASSLGDFLSF